MTTCLWVSLLLLDHLPLLIEPCQLIGLTQPGLDSIVDGGRASPIALALPPCVCVALHAVVLPTVSAFHPHVAHV